MWRADAYIGCANVRDVRHLSGENEDVAHLDTGVLLKRLRLAQAGLQITLGLVEHRLEGCKIGAPDPVGDVLGGAPLIKRSDVAQ